MKAGKKISKTHLLNNHAYLSTRSRGTHAHKVAGWLRGGRPGGQGGQANREWGLAGWRYNPEPLKANKGPGPGQTLKRAPAAASIE